MNDSDSVSYPTRFGFRFGPAVVSRATAMPDGAVCVQVTTEAGREIDVYVSPAGRSIRVFSRGKEWKPA